MKNMQWPLSLIPTVPIDVTDADMAATLKVVTIGMIVDANADNRFVIAQHEVCSLLLLEFRMARQFKSPLLTPKSLLKSLGFCAE
jgi:hypothetical protein